MLKLRGPGGVWFPCTHSGNILWVGMQRNPTGALLIHRGSPLPICLWSAHSSGLKTELGAWALSWHCSPEPHNGAELPKFILEKNLCEALSLSGAPHGTRYRERGQASSLPQGHLRGCICVWAGRMLPVLGHSLTPHSSASSAGPCVIRGRQRLPFPQD